MSTPSIFKKRGRILKQAPGRRGLTKGFATTSPPLGGSVLSSRQLGFLMETQLQSNWCWAAVATSVSLFFDPQSIWQQCLVVNQEFQLATCCQDGGSEECDRPWRLERGLNRVGRDGGNASGSLSFSAIQQEIDNQRPVGCFIQWAGGGIGHFVVIEGYRAQGATKRVQVEDPYFGSSDYDFDDFRLRYQNSSGVWQWTYFTR